MQCKVHHAVHSTTSSAQYIMQCTAQHAVHSTACSAKYTMQCTVHHAVHSTSYAVHSTPYAVHITSNSVHSRPYAEHSTPYVVHSTPCSAQYTTHCIVQCLHSTRYTDRWSPLVRRAAGFPRAARASCHLLFLYTVCTYSTMYSTHIYVPFSTAAAYEFRHLYLCEGIRHLHIFPCLSVRENSPPICTLEFATNISLHAYLYGGIRHLTVLGKSPPIHRRESPPIRTREFDTYLYWVIRHLSVYTGKCWA